ncbi:MAG: pyrroline-5-carboxylate reductase [Faecalibacterium sp.]|nr:pyrroline-5-carboxylate reductase [Ruminococcus sp.]MCM1392848.1 pyrroline-5-carboxylate reductase [Ruminococcus sp.]MCM1486413.1 pyrroline-5-carboxylate reductase [Faecalibacterium sp.]
MIGFIGAGNMATAIIKGLVASKTTSADEIAVYNIHSDKAEKLAAEYGIRVMDSAKEIALNCDTIVLSVKPNVLPTVLDEIKNEVKKSNPLLISIAAGKTLDFIGSHLAEETRIVRVMPNINAKVGASISAFCGNAHVTDDDLAFVDGFCSAFGKAINLPENHFAVFGVIGGCSPAFAYMFIDAMARAAVKNGLPKAQALEISAQAVLGSAKMILESEEHPWQLVDKVCSPGGTTIEGVLSLQSDGFESAVANAVDAAFEKDKRL